MSASTEYLKRIIAGFKGWLAWNARMNSDTLPLKYIYYVSAPLQVSETRTLREMLRAGPARMHDSPPMPSDVAAWAEAIVRQAVEVAREFEAAHCGRDCMGSSADAILRDAGLEAKDE